MYLLIVYAIIALIVYVSIYNSTDISTDISTSLGMGTLLNLLFLMVFVVASLIVLDNSEKKLVNSVQHPLIAVEGTYATMTDHGIVVVYKKDGIITSNAFHNMKEMNVTDAVPYLQVDSYVATNKWALMGWDGTENTVYFPKNMLKVVKALVEVERK